MKRNNQQEDPKQRELFETIRATYPLALEPEQHAMIKQLRTGMATISVEERMALIDTIQSSIGQSLEEEFEL